MWVPYHVPANEYFLSYPPFVRQWQNAKMPPEDSLRAEDEN